MNTNILQTTLDRAIEINLPIAKIENYYKQLVLLKGIEYNFTPIRKELQLRELQRLFVEKYNVIKSVAIDKKGDEEYLKAQAEVYDYMRECAESKFYDKVTSRSIIKANKNAKIRLNRILLLLNKVRSVVENKINNNIDVTNDLNIISNLSLEIFNKVGKKTTMKAALKELGIE